MTVPTDDPLDPADAFDLLGDETRVRILETLGDAWVEDWPGVLPYSTLMRRVGVDDSGRFHYHLSRLVDRFVESRPDGYTLNFTGLTLYRTIHAGTVTATVERGPFDAGCACHACGGDLIARYDRDMFVVKCPDCGDQFCEIAVAPRTATERTESGLLAVADSLDRNYLRLAVDGVCPWCAGVVDSTVLEASVSELDRSGTQSFHVRYTCRRCGGRLWHPVGFHVLVDPAVAGALVEGGVPARSRPFWEFAFAVTDDHTTMLDSDPWRFRVSLPLDDRSRTAVLGPDRRVERLD